MRKLKTHLIAETHIQAGTLYGTTACGEGFFRDVSPGATFQAVRRIGALEAAADRNFEPDKHACKKCIGYWMYNT